MRSLSSTLLIEKNRLESDDPWLILVDLVLSTVTLYLVRNTSDIVFQGRTYTAFPFELDLFTETSEGEVPQVQIRVSNVTRVIQGYIEEIAGAVDATATIHVVNSANLSEDYSDLDLTFRVVKTEATAEWVVFHCGLPSPLTMRYPVYRYLGEHCNWVFKGYECGYNGPAIVCDRTFEYCSRLENTFNFGGFLGLSRGKVRFV